MRRFPIRAGLATATALVILCCPACQRGPRFYPVQGKVLLDGKAPEGALVVFRPANSSDPQMVQPAAHVQADGSFTLRSYVPQDRSTRDGAMAGEYLVSVVWYPPDLDKYPEEVPDLLHGRYSSPDTSGLRAEIKEGPTTLPPFELHLKK